MRGYFDQRTTLKYFQKGYLVLLWNKEKENMSMHASFNALWIKIYQIEKQCVFNSYLLKKMDVSVVKKLIK